MKQRTEIMQDVFLTYLPATKFKTSSLSAYLVRSLNKSDASFNALLPMVLRRGTKTYPDMESISAALDVLYGAQIESSVHKKGERQCIGFYANCIDDAFTPGGEKLLEKVTELLGELFLNPYTPNGVFWDDYVENEKNNLIDGLRAIKNDKRDWADVRLMQEMCKDEPYGVLRFGDEETISNITSQSLFDYYRRVLADSRFEFIYCGSASLERVENAIQKVMHQLPRTANMQLLPAVVRVAAPEVPRKIEESMDVTQGKLSMGWRCNTDDVPAMILANLIFGGTSNSKLFMNVREKLSLCYYASSSYARSKGIITVSSGIEVKDYDAAVEEILNQLRLVQQGQWEDWEFDGALAMMLSSLASVYDSQGSISNYYLGNIVTDLQEDPEELGNALRKVTKERIMKAADTMKLDTIYFLKGKVN